VPDFLKFEPFDYMPVGPFSVSSREARPFARWKLGAAVIADLVQAVAVALCLLPDGGSVQVLDRNESVVFLFSAAGGAMGSAVAMLRRLTLADGLEGRSVATDAIFLVPCSCAGSKRCERCLLLLALGAAGGVAS
jgi:hypothetical protein